MTWYYFSLNKDYLDTSRHSLYFKEKSSEFFLYINLNDLIERGITLSLSLFHMLKTADKNVIGGALIMLKAKAVKEVVSILGCFFDTIII